MSNLLGSGGPVASSCRHHLSSRCGALSSRAPETVIPSGARDLAGLPRPIPGQDPSRSLGMTLLALHRATSSPRLHDPAALPEPDPHGPRPLGIAAHDHLVPVLQKPSRLSGRQRERLGASAGELEQRPERVLRRPRRSCRSRTRRPGGGCSRCWCGGPASARRSSRDRRRGRGSAGPAAALRAACGRRRGTPRPRCRSRRSPGLKGTRGTAAARDRPRAGARPARGTARAPRASPSRVTSSS